jgi:predicted RNase H-related nuclease YkuK (DUF458 family)
MVDIDMDEIIDYLDTVSPDSKIYIGCDSEVIKLRRRRGIIIRYAIVVVVHIAGSQGAKIFGTFESDKVNSYDDYRVRPQYRLMNECYKVTELYTKMVEVFPDKGIEVHLDLNPNKEHLSNKVVNQALGYVKGMTGQDALLKPDAWAASAAADKWYTVKTRENS